MQTENYPSVYCSWVTRRRDRCDAVLGPAIDGSHRELSKERASRDDQDLAQRKGEGAKDCKLFLLASPCRSARFEEHPSRSR